jgi:hypothetical protein
MHHRDDPEPSRVAAQRHSASGKRESNAELVYRAVKASLYKAPTAGEIQDLIAWWASRDDDNVWIDTVEVRRRLYDLSRQTPPLVRRGEPRKCRVAGNLQSTWWPIERTET